MAVEKPLAGSNDCFVFGGTGFYKRLGFPGVCGTCDWSHIYTRLEKWGWQFVAGRQVYRPYSCTVVGDGGSFLATTYFFAVLMAHFFTSNIIYCG